MQTWFLEVVCLRAPVSLGCVCQQDSQSSEDREMLARVAASAENPKSSDNEAAIEKYLRSVLAVENILTLDRLRQVTQLPSLILFDLIRLHFCI